MADEKPMLKAGDICLDMARERLTVGGEPVALRRKALLVLHALMSQPLALIDKRELIRVGWGDVPVTDAVLATAIKTIRRAVGDDARAPRVIENVHGRGYRFLLEVTSVATEATSEVPRSKLRSGAHDGDSVQDDAPRKLTPQTDSSGNLASGEPQEPLPGDRAGERQEIPASQIRRWRLPTIALALLTIALAWSLGSLRTPPVPAEEEASPQPVAAPSGRQSVAVLPLVDMSPRGDRGWFVDGLTEEILNELAQSPDLEVVSRTSSFRYRNTDADIREIARELGVDHVIEGSVRAAGNRLRITIQLIRAQDGLHLFSESWDRPYALEDVLTVQQEISRRVLAALGGALSPRTEPASSPRADDGGADVNLTAYEDYLHGRELVISRTREGLLEGLALLKRSAGAAPDFAPSHALLAVAHIFGAEYLGTAFAEVEELATGHLRVATALAPDSVEVLTARALLATVQRDHELALDLSDRAIGLVPSHVEAHYRRSNALMNLGRTEDALVALRRAALLDPLDPLINASLANALIAERKPAEAVDVAQHLIEHNPDNNIALGSAGQVHALVGDYARAGRYLREARQLNPDVALSMFWYAELLWRLGADELLLSSSHAAFWAGRAAVLLERNRTDEAVALAKANQTFNSAQVDALDIAFWARDLALGQDLAMKYLGRDGGRDVITSRRNVREYFQLISLLGGAPPADQLRDVMSVRYEGWTPARDSIQLASDFYAAAAWHLMEGDRDGALEWLERAARRGYLLRELRLSPVFDALRDEPRFDAVLSTMAERASECRQLLGDLSPAVQR